MLVFEDFGVGVRALSYLVSAYFFNIGALYLREESFDDGGVGVEVESSSEFSELWLGVISAKTYELQVINMFVQCHSTWGRVRRKFLLIFLWHHTCSHWCTRLMAVSWKWTSTGRTIQAICLLVEFDIWRCPHCSGWKSSPLVRSGRCPVAIVEAIIAIDCRDN